MATPEELAMAIPPEEGLEEAPAAETGMKPGDAGAALIAALKAEDPVAVEEAIAMCNDYLATKPV